jgi:hypothetical protein
MSRLHRTRHLSIRQQTSVINAIRAHLAELGIVAPGGPMVLTNCSVTSPIPAQMGRGNSREYQKRKNPACPSLAVRKWLRENNWG